MKKSLLIAVLSLLFSPTIAKAQTDTVEFVSLNMVDTCMLTHAWQDCHFTIMDAGNNTIVPTSFYSSGGFATIEFPYQPSAAPYFLILDEPCLSNHGVFLDNHVFEITQSSFGGNSTQVVNNELRYYHYAHIQICSPQQPVTPLRLFNLEVDYVNCGNALVTCPARLFKDGIEITPPLSGMSGVNYWGHVYDINASYTLRYEDSCLASIGMQLPQYTYQIHPQYTHADTFAMYYYQTFIIECETRNDTIIPIDTCSNLYAFVNPYLGYYQNTSNQISLSWGNTSPTVQNVIITLEVPPGVVMNGSWYGYAYNQTGNQVTLNRTLPAHSSFYDVLNLNVPGGLNNGTLHTYSVHIYSAGISECDTTDNTDYLDMIVGNSYDPNNKTVNQPKIIAPDVQDQLVYTIRFQNTGSAPAQDVYIDDTLSNHLDWSTFVVLKSSHTVEVIDMGNGIKRFKYAGIWLPDSTSNITESQGFVTFSIKEKASNGEGTEILNTAYIYFDHNPAIITNTTYNINTSNELGLESLTKNTVTLFPNPAFSSIQVTSDIAMEKIELFDITGKQCFQIPAAGISKIISIDPFDSGIYFIKITAGKETSTLRFIKQ